ncbi:MAG: PaaI family thioesterase, partial [Gemmobacter sp.]|nr:PaaI family thioesterase [Gemmobacter sp.]
MTLAMDIPTLHTFIQTAFPQVADDFRVDRLGPDGLTVRLLIDDRHLRPGGTVSGPSMFALADVAVYLAVLSRIGPVALAVTTNCSIDFMRKPEAARDLL